MRVVESSLQALRLVLDELGVEPEIDTVDDRKRVQKAVYLAQLSGVDLGYRYGWYLMGPYCPDLTRDYYKLADIIAQNQLPNDVELSEAAVKRLQRIKPVVATPKSLSKNLTDDQWLELAASVHYLAKVKKCAAGDANIIMERQKPKLAPYANTAREELQKAALL